MEMFLYCVLFIPAMVGLYYKLCSKVKKMRRFTRFKELKNYAEVIQATSAAYLFIGSVFGCFMTYLYWAYNLFQSSMLFRILPWVLILVLQIIIDTMINVKFQLQEYDKAQEEKNKK